MNTVLITIAFTAGILAFLSPCAAAMLPAYTGYFLSSENNESNIYECINAGARFGLMLTLGFATVFIVIGAVLLIIGNVIVSLLPWISIFIGIMLVLIALYELLGKDIPLPYIGKLQTFMGNILPVF